MTSPIPGAGGSLCRQLGMTVEEMAEAAAVARDTVRSWERGAASPRGQAAERVAELLQAAGERPESSEDCGGQICDAVGCRRRSPQGARWCGVHQRRRTRSDLQGDVAARDGATLEAAPGDEGDVGEPSGFGLLGVVDRDHYAVMCHECGSWYKALAPHLRAAHEMTVAEYREVHQLPAQIGLTSLASAQTNSEHARERIGTPGWERFTQARDQVLPTARTMGIEANRHTTAGTRAARAADARERLAPPRRDEQKWQQRLASYREFVETHCRQPSRGSADEEERFLAVWVKNQRAEARRGKLPESRRVALAGVGVDLEG